MKKKNILIYGTCQGTAISKFLITNDGFNSMFNKPIIVLNYENIHNNTFWATSKVLKDIDVFIYQPLDDSYGNNSTDYIKTLLKPQCITISIPYVFDLSLWPLIVSLKGDTTTEWQLRDGYKKVLLNTEPIDKLLNEGLTKEQILSLYDENAINFNYEIRHRISMNSLYNKEINLDIKVHDFIVNNLKIKRLFMYASHPTSHIFVHMSNQILKILNLNEINDDFILDYANIQSPIPIAYPTSSVNVFKFEFTTENEEKIANNYYRAIISDYIKLKK